MGEDDKPDETSTQSLACYSTDEIYELCKQADLEIIAYFPGDARDFVNWKYDGRIAIKMPQLSDKSQKM